MPLPETIYPSKRDVWLVAVLVAAGLLSLGITVVTLRNPLSSPALSLDRLEIRYAFGAIMISPPDQRRFLEDLVQRTPGLGLDGTRAIRP